MTDLTKHHCGLTGFDPMKGDEPCPACARPDPTKPGDVPEGRKPVHSFVGIENGITWWCRVPGCGKRFDAEVHAPMTTDPTKPSKTWFCFFFGCRPCGWPCKHHRDDHHCERCGRELNYYGK